MPQVTLTKHFNKIGIHEGTPEEINIQQLKASLKINAFGASSTPDEDVRSTPQRIRKKQKKDDNQQNGSVQSGPKCFRCDTTGAAVKPCDVEGCSHHACGIHRDWITQGVIGSVMVMISEYVASAVSATPPSNNVKMWFAVTGVVISTRSGEWTVSHSSVNGAQPTLGDAAITSDQTVSVCSFNVMILIACIPHATDTWPGASQTLRRSTRLRRWTAHQCHVQS
eukprot:6085759-Amphidinium_carterae.2